MEHQKTNSNSQRQHDDWDDVHNQLIDVQQQQKIQKKSLEISSPGDADEKEADEISRQVTSGQSAEIHGTGSTINRQVNGDGIVDVEFQSQLSAGKGSGQPLPENIQQELGGKMNTDFSGVRVHTGARAHAMNEQVNAKAFTHGQDVYFREGEYNPSSPKGKELIAHELVHTVQQSNPGGESIQRTHEEDEFNVYVQHKIDLYNAELKKLQDANDVEGTKNLTRAHGKFLEDVKSFRKKMGKNNGAGWGGKNYDKKLTGRFDDYKTRVDEKKELVRGEITTAIGLIGGDLQNAIDLVGLAISSAKLNSADATRLLKKANEKLDSANHAKLFTAHLMSGEDEKRLLLEYDSIINDYKTLIAEIEKNIEGHRTDQGTFGGLLPDLEKQKQDLADILKLAAGENDVLELIKIKDKALPDLHISIQNSIATAKATNPQTKAVNDEGLPARLSDLNKRADAVLQDPALLKQKKIALGKITKKSPRLAVLIELIHDQLVASSPDKQIIFVNLQKLGTQKEIDDFKKYYKQYAGTEIESDLRLKLSGADLQLALEFLKIEATVGQTSLIGTMPATDPQRDALAATINTALNNSPVDLQTVYASLIPFNRNEGELSQLKTRYELVFPTHTLEGDIKAKIADDNEESYAIYLLNALAAAGPEDNTDVHKTGTVADRHDVTGGRATGRTGVEYGFPGRRFPGGYSLDYSGQLAPDTHWLQFVWREVVWWSAVDAHGMGVGPEQRKSGSTSVTSAAGTMNLTTDPAHKQIITDGTTYDSPFYEGAATHERTDKNTVMYDRPGPWPVTIGTTPRIANRIHFKTYLVRDFLPVLEETILVEYIQTPTSSPTEPTSITITSKPVTALDPEYKAVLLTEYPKFSYIR